MSANIGWLFYKDYFRSIDYGDLANEQNANLIKEKVQHIIDQKPTITESIILGNTHFKATTSYPGLLLGSGNAHELPDVKGQAILGFHFDYTSGLPVIQGSSIKGVLRSAFKHPDYIQELLLNVPTNIEDLEKEIFDNNDIFFDATIIKADANSKILADDYITPHADALKDPKPLRFIKVLPDVTFRFDFELSDGIISKETKRKLFENILEDLGLGAKTNVGYGQFINFKKYQTQEEKEAQEKELELKKEQEKLKREKEIEDAKKAKAQKAEQGVNALSEIKNLDDAFKLLKDTFGAKPKPTPEQKQEIQNYFNKQKNLSKSQIKVFKKYGVS